jgi:hypothetical protein
VATSAFCTLYCTLRGTAPRLVENKNSPEHGLTRAGWPPISPEITALNASPKIMSLWPFEIKDHTTIVKRAMHVPAYTIFKKQ